MVHAPSSHPPSCPLAHKLLLPLGTWCSRASPIPSLQPLPHHLHSRSHHQWDQDCNIMAWNTNRVSHHVEPKVGLIHPFSSPVLSDNSRLLGSSSSTSFISTSSLP
ncbi:hypothetical protein Hanom_Chr04g00308601 [Helianthus anomalus]